MKCQDWKRTGWNQDCQENINNLRYADDITLRAENREELKNLLMKVKEESEKVGLKFNIHKTKIMISGPITSWQINGEAVETLRDFIFLGSKITADGDCSDEFRRCWLQRKAMTDLDSILKSRHYFADKGPSSQSYAFSSSHVWTWEWKWKLLSHVRLFATPWTIQSMEFSRPEYWNGYLSLL